jgi:hypothetical protein
VADANLTGPKVLTPLLCAESRTDTPENWGRLDELKEQRKTERKKGGRGRVGLRTAIGSTVCDTYTDTDSVMDPCLDRERYMREAAMDLWSSCQS